MRGSVLCVLAACLLAAAAAPGKSSLQTGNSEDGQVFVDEVVVESLLQVRSPSARQARVNTRSDLQHGTRVQEQVNNKN